MENYSLWNGMADEGAVRLYATAINMQEIGTGTAAFIDTLLADFGQSGSASDWSVSGPFATSYLCQDDESSEWRDRWWLTWDIRIGLTTAPAPVPDPLVDTFAYDESWTGKEASPEAFTVIVKAPDSARATELHAVLSGAVGGKHDVARSGTTPATTDLITQVARKLKSRRSPRAQVSPGRRPGLIEVRIESGRPRLIPDAVATAELIEQLARSLGADTRLRPS
ncbi:hypothetical protein [Aeromicrobium sp.]|uniref:hypothetical protein n=1 Tax=Aeromicrobium sp. TaxID=1871063 RepID=UPI002FC60ED9